MPDVLVCSVGTEIFFESSGEADKAWQTELDRDWDRAGAIAAAKSIPGLKPQASVHCDRAPYHRSCRKHWLTVSDFAFRQRANSDHIS